MAERRSWSAVVEIAELAGDAESGATDRCLPIAEQVVALLTGLMR